MAKVKYKAGGASWNLDDEFQYFGLLTKIEKKVNPKNAEQEITEYHFEIINDKPLKGEPEEGGESSLGKELKTGFFSNSYEDGEFYYPLTGAFRVCNEGLCDFLGLDFEEADDDEYIGGVVRFMIENKSSKKNPEDKREFTHIKNDTIKAIDEAKIERVKKMLKEYKASKKEDSKPKKEETKKPKVDDDEDFDDEPKTQTKKTEPKKEEKKKSKKESSDDDDGFFD